MNSQLQTKFLKVDLESTLLGQLIFQLKMASGYKKFYCISFVFVIYKELDKKYSFNVVL